MQFFGALILFMTLSAACGLRCYSCSGLDCTDVETCPREADSCAITDLNGYFTKSCMFSGACVSPISCCKWDLCNDHNQLEETSAAPTGSSVFLLLVSSAIITVFL